MRFIYLKDTGPRTQGGFQTDWHPWAVSGTYGAHVTSPGHLHLFGKLLLHFWRWWRSDFHCWSVGGCFCRGLYFTCSL